MSINLARQNLDKDSFLETAFYLNFFIHWYTFELRETVSMYKVYTGSSQTKSQHTKSQH